MLGLLWVLLFTECDGCSSKTNVAVFEFEAVGIEKDLVTTISDLLRLELSECDKYKVIDKGTMIDTLGEDLVVSSMDKAVEYSDSLGASLVVIGHMSKLGNKIIISVSLINKWEKERIYTDKLTSSSVEDLEIVVKRLATSLCEMKKAKESVTVETVTEEEATPRRRRESYHTVGLLVGYLFPMGGSYGKKTEGNWYEDTRLSGDVRRMPGGSGVYIYENPNYMAQVVYRLHGRSQSSLANVAFSGYRFLSLEDISPYVGGGLGMGWGTITTSVDSTYSEYSETWHYHINPESFDGLSLELGGGVMLFRTYDFHFLADLKYHIVFGGGIPNGFILSFGISYKKKSGGGCGCGF
ncbi:hypothetical protein KAW50_01795 [candidate division WOR-3 bacterium]|nr:hypothetical protein [candidate division WOR-3 bacterium]